MHKIMALDIGTKRIGIALSDFLHMLSTGHSCIARMPENEAVNTISKIAQENRVEEIVIGVPINMDGTKGFQADDCLAESHIQEQSRNWMRLDIFNAESLIVVRYKLQSPSPPITVWSLGGWMARFTALDAASVIEVFTRLLLVSVMLNRHLSSIGIRLCTGINLGTRVFNRQLHQTIGQ